MSTNHPPRPSIPRAVIFAPLVLIVLLALGWAYMAYSTRGPLAGDTRHDFGVIEILARNPPDEPTDITLTYTFHLTNRTSKTLVMKSARPDCGCLTVNAECPITIPPGGPVDVPITMKRAAAPGIKSESKTVLIHLDFGDDGIQVLRVKAATKTK